MCVDTFSVSVQAVTAQLPSSNQQFLQGGQQLVQNGQQFLQSGQQFLQSGQQFVQNQQLAQPSQFQTQFVPRPQFQQQQFQQFQPQQQFQQPQQFQQTQFQRPQQFQQFQQQQPQQSGNALGDLASSLLGALGRRRRKRQTSLHGQAIRLMQNLGLQNMGAYPFVRAAIIGHANRDRPGNCNQLYLQCPSGTDQLLSYFNNHNGGVLQNALPSVTNEVGSLFPGISSLPQVNNLL